MLSRRKFIKSCLASLGVAFTAAPLISHISSVLEEQEVQAKVPLTNEQKETLIAKALSTNEGRTALAQSMVEPIHRSLDYQAVGRKLLLVKR